MFPLLLAFAFVLCAPGTDNQPNDSGRAIELPALPVYPKDGIFPVALKDRFVFLDQQTNQFIVAFRTTKGSTTRSIAQRTSLATGVCPSLTASFKKNETGAIDYEYQVANLAGVRQELSTWVLPLAFREPVRITRAPLGLYGAEASPDKTIQAGAFEAMTYALSKDRIQQLQNTMIRRKVDWFARSVDGIAPRQARGPYRITSKALPGIVTTYFQRFFLPTANSSWPPEVLGQVLTLSSTENNSVSLLTVGPKFDPGIKQSEIASDYRTVIVHAIKQKRLRPSAFLSEALARLTELAIDPANQISFKVTSQPSTPLERQILSALELSLSQH
ncbi:MAG: hypothetical protein M3O20_08510 [Acidobacteriota bacterium]|nr:hypothetical protein [Acidobacteriota bacterium]